MEDWEQEKGIGEEVDDAAEEMCDVYGNRDQCESNLIVLCEHEGCNFGCHQKCHKPPLTDTVHAQAASDLRAGALQDIGRDRSFTPNAVLLVLGAASDADYAAHYVLAPHGHFVKVLHTWFECYRHSCTPDDCGTLAIPFSRIVRDALGTPLSLACALCFSPHIPEDASFCRKERSL
jgi:hypothetical protein